MHTCLGGSVYPSVRFASKVSRHIPTCLSEPTGQARPATTKTRPHPLTRHVITPQQQSSDQCTRTQATPYRQTERYYERHTQGCRVDTYCNAIACLSLCLAVRCCSMCVVASRVPRCSRMIIARWDTTCWDHMQLRRGNSDHKTHLNGSHVSHNSFSKKCVNRCVSTDGKQPSRCRYRMCVRIHHASSACRAANWSSSLRGFAACCCVLTGAGAEGAASAETPAASAPAGTAGRPVGTVPALNSLLSSSSASSSCSSFSSSSSSMMGCPLERTCATSFCRSCCSCMSSIKLSILSMLSRWFMIFCALTPVCRASTATVCVCALSSVMICCSSVSRALLSWSSSWLNSFLRLRASSAPRLSLALVLARASSSCAWMRFSRCCCRFSRVAMASLLDLMAVGRSTAGALFSSFLAPKNNLISAKQ
mmetsp:Transcript_39012/g.97648  ORF Transcript_39012/g.97648 Transcript_39012/m.97648 type:complete len:422 (-) Transcript_39012:128-1393(-)